MRICIDCRSLSNQERTGVGQVTYNLVEKLLTDSPPKTSYILLTSGLKQVHLKNEWTQLDHVSHKHIAMPNKILHMWILLFGRPFLDKLVGGSDWFISPNLHFSSLSLNTKSLLVVHDLGFAIQPKWYTPWGRIWHKLARPKKQMHQAHAILVPSEQTRLDIRFYYGVSLEKIHVTSWGLASMYKDKKNTISFPKNVQWQKYFLFLGTLEPRKNITSLLDAYESGNFFSKGIGLVIAGSSGWSSQALQQRIQTIQGVQYLGYVAEEEKPSLYTHALAFVYPSLYEGFGLPPLEAMACGTPTIISDSPGLTDICGDAAYLVDPLRVQSIRQAMKHMATDGQLRTWYSKQGEEHSRKFSWATVKKDIEAIIYG